MASLQLVRRIHLQGGKWSSPTLKIVGQLKSLVGIGDKNEVVDIDSSGQDAKPEGEFMFDDVSKRMSVVVSESLQSTENWEDIPLQDLNHKFKLIKGCHHEFGVVPPNNVVHESKSVQAFLHYYSSLRKPHIIPEVLRFQKDKLPANLTFQPPLPFKPAKRKS